MVEPLAPKFSLKELRLSPKDREGFSRAVLGVMHKVAKEAGPVVVRFGRTGTGVAPNYRLEDFHGRPVQAIDGATHRPWPSDAAFDGADTWSEITMTYEDVQQAIANAMGTAKNGAH